MKKPHAISVFLCLLVSVSLLFTGCAEKKTDTSNQTQSTASMTTGTVVQVDTQQKQITVSEMGELPSGSSLPEEGSMPEGGEQPEENALPEGEAPAGENSAQDGQQPPEKPEGDEQPEGNAMPEGEAPAGENNAQDGQQPPEKPEDGEQPEENALPEGEAPAGENNAQDGQQPPEKPEGDEQPEGGSMPDGEAPAGENNAQDGQQPSEKPEGETKTYTYTDTTTFTDAEGNAISPQELTVGSLIQYTAQEQTLLTVQLAAMGSGTDMQMMGNGGQQPGGSTQAPTEYAAVNHYTQDTQESGVEQTSTGTDECIGWVSDGASVTLSGVTATRSSADSTGGDNASFYGVGAAYLVSSGTLNLSDSTIATDAAGGAGVFAYGDGVAFVSDCSITTQQNTSGGIHVAGGGTLYATNLQVETNGASSAAIRSDRGSGVMTVDGGSYTANGTGSPAVYSTADISVANATLTATQSEAVCIEGKNALRLTDCDVSCQMPDNEQNDTTWSVIVYQSMSGDSEEGTGSFEMTGGSLYSAAGGLFYTTNTQSTFTLQGVEITTASAPDFFLKCTGNANQRGWGSTGANGAQCLFTAIQQQMQGDILWDSISTLELQITQGSCLTGAVRNDESHAGSGGDGYANVTVDADSSWIVTGDSTLTTLTLLGTLADAQGNPVSVVGTDGTVYVSGSSAYTVTVQSFQSE